MERIYIKDFIDELNYHAAILYVDSEVDLDDLYNRLHREHLSHLNRFDAVRENRLFYIENCDLQDITITPDWNELIELIENGHSILHLKKDPYGFYVLVPDIYELRHDYRGVNL